MLLNEFMCVDSTHKKLLHNSNLNIHAHHHVILMFDMIIKTSLASPVNEIKQGAEGQ